MVQERSLRKDLGLTKLKDPYHVLDKIPDSPEYWKSKKYELLAKLDNFGPFQYFFTLSCADKRWEENFGVLLHELDVQLSYESDNLTDKIKIWIFHELSFLNHDYMPLICSVQVVDFPYAITQRID